LNDRDPDVKVAAMQALGAMRYERGVQALTDLFQFYARGPLAEASLDALAHIGHASSVPLFAAQLAGKPGPLKAIGIEGLARMGIVDQADAISAALRGEKSEPVLLAGQFASVMLQNGSIDPIAEALLRPKLRDQALRYLLEVAPGRASAFVRHAQDPDERLRMDIADTLGRSGDPAALRVIEPLLQDHNPLVAAAAARAVARLRAATTRSTF
jgi:HEAT repeat protein